VGGHQSPPRSCVGHQKTLKVYNPQLQRIIEEHVELKLLKGASWNWWVATNIHLDQERRGGVSKGGRDTERENYNGGRGRNVERR
jgi:hypothetical protein